MSEQQELNRSVLEKLRNMGGDKFLGELINLFLEHAPKKLEEALASERSGDMEALERAVHSLKSSAGNLGAVAVQDLAGHIEQLASEKQAESIPPLMRELEKKFARLPPWLEEIKRGASN